MGHFSNGTEGDIYQEQYCFQCVNYKEDDKGTGCPIWDMHFALNDNKKYQFILDMLIPRGDIFNKQCSMYIHEKTKDVKTLDLYDKEANP